MWSVECSNFFFFKRNFLPQARSLCVRETVSFLCSKAVRDDWDLRAVSDVDEVKGGSTANHQSLNQRWAEETREPHSETWKAVLSRRTEGQGEGQMRERKKRHRSNGHYKVYHISMQLESEKLSQSQLGVFWRKRLTRGKNHINITVLNQYMKPSNVLLQGCSVELGPAVLLLPQDCVCKQCRSGASRLRPWEFVLVMYSLPQGSAGFAQNRSGCGPATLLFKIRHWF